MSFKESPESLRPISRDGRNKQVDRSLCRDFMECGRSRGLKCRIAWYCFFSPLSFSADLACPTTVIHFSAEEDSIWQCNCPATKNDENNSFFKAPKRKYKHKLSIISKELRPSRDLFTSLAASLRERFQSISHIQALQVGQESAKKDLVWACF